MLSIQYFVQIRQVDDEHATVPNTGRDIVPLMGPLDIYFPDFGFYYGQLRFTPTTTSDESPSQPIEYVIDPANILIRNDIKSDQLVKQVQQLVSDRFIQMNSHIYIGPTLKCIVQPDASHHLTIKGLMVTEFFLATSCDIVHRIMISDGSYHRMTLQELTDHGPFDFTPIYHMTRPAGLNLQIKLGVTGDQKGFYADYRMRPRMLTRADCQQIGGNLRHLHIFVDAPPPIFTIRRTIGGIYCTFPEIDMKQLHLPTVYGFAEYLGPVTMFMVYDITTGEIERAWRCRTDDGQWRWDPMTIDEVDQCYRMAEYI
jgi:hypothetical protein